MNKYDLCEKRNALKTIYIEYAAELAELYENSSQFDKEIKKSCPYYIQIPDNWFDKENRILIVGEEGSGDGKIKNSDGTETEINISTEFEAALSVMQTFNYEYMRVQLGIETDPKIIETHGKNNSPFWNRFRKIREISEFGSIAWSNIDKIHNLNPKRKSYRLSESDRKALHSTKIAVLKNEIEILEPTMVVFFGWYNTSLKHELPDLYKQLYVKNEVGNYIWKNNVVSFKHDNINYIFSYHPGWGCRQKDGYEEKVRDEVERRIRQSLNPNST